MGKLRQFEGHTWLELFVAWPALDQTPKTLKVWLDQDGRRSGAYTIQLRHGRTAFYDAWQLPDLFKGVEGRHVWLRTADLLGVQRTWRGDWRQPVDIDAQPVRFLMKVVPNGCRGNTATPISWATSAAMVRRTSATSRAGFISAISHPMVDRKQIAATWKPGRL